MNDEHPAARLRSSVLTLRRRAILVVGAFGAVMLAHGWDFVARQWSIGLLRAVPDLSEGAGPDMTPRLETADALVNGGGIAILIAYVVTAVVFLRWTHRLVALTRALGVHLRWAPAQAVWAFLIPIVSLVRPYQVLSAANAALDPENVEPPAPRVDPAAQVDYRSVGFIEPSPPRRVPSPLIGAWWAAFLAMSIGDRLTSIGGAPATPAAVVSAYQGEMFVSCLALVAAAFGINVVRGLTARVEERFRRIRESSPESLDEQGIVLS